MRAGASKFRSTEGREKNELNRVITTDHYRPFFKDSLLHHQSLGTISLKSF